MLKFILMEENNNKVVYEYFPEGSSESGVVSYNKETAACGIETLAKNDRHKIYAVKLFKRLREMAVSGIFEKQGTIAWY